MGISIDSFGPRISESIDRHRFVKELGFAKICCVFQTFIVLCSLAAGALHVSFFYNIFHAKSFDPLTEKKTASRLKRPSVEFY